jgi:hypothetical protein
MLEDGRQRNRLQLHGMGFCHAKSALNWRYQTLFTQENPAFLTAINLQKI